MPYGRVKAGRELDAMIAEKVMGAPALAAVGSEVPA